MVWWKLNSFWNFQQNATESNVPDPWLGNSRDHAYSCPRDTSQHIRAPINTFLPTVPTFAVRETTVSLTANVGTVGMNGLMGPIWGPPSLKPLGTMFTWCLGVSGGLNLALHYADRRLNSSSLNWWYSLFSLVLYGPVCMLLPFLVICSKSCQKIVVSSLPKCWLPVHKLSIVKLDK